MHVFGNGCRWYMNESRRTEGIACNMKRLYDFVSVLRTTGIRSIRRVKIYITEDCVSMLAWIDCVRIDGDLGRFVYWHMAFTRSEVRITVGCTGTFVEWEEERSLIVGEIKPTKWNRCFRWDAEDVVRGIILSDDEGMYSIIENPVRRLVAEALTDSDKDNILWTGTFSRARGDSN